MSALPNFTRLDPRSIEAMVTKDGRTISADSAEGEYLLELRKMLSELRALGISAYDTDEVTAHKEEVARKGFRIASSGFIAGVWMWLMKKPVRSAPGSHWTARLLKEYRGPMPSEVRELGKRVKEALPLRGVRVHYFKNDPFLALHGYTPIRSQEVILYFAVWGEDKTDFQIASIS